MDAVAGPASDAHIAEFALAWAHAVAGTSYVPLEVDEIAAQLAVHTRRLFRLWAAVPFDPEPARQIGAGLVDQHFTHPETLGRTVALLTGLLPDGEPITPESALRIGALQGALAVGYTGRLQERTLGEQDSIRSAAMTALADAELAARTSEARFRAVFAGAAIGIGVGDTTGNILDVNPALAKMLRYSQAGDAQPQRRRVHPPGRHGRCVAAVPGADLRQPGELPHRQAVRPQRRGRALDAAHRVADPRPRRGSRSSRSR